MSLVFKEDIDGPATHAIVIGVGAYRHLVGCDNDTLLFREHNGLGQLTSPPHSARALANWLLRSYRNPEKPLASLDLLVSEKGDSRFEMQAGNVVDVEHATMANVKQAVNRWKDRGDTNADNLMFFFFCGHGLASGSALALLLEDYGESPHAPLENAVNFNSGLYLGMDKCKARYQCYFIDACRSSSSVLTSAAATGFVGNPIIHGSAAFVGNRQAPIYYSTIAGSQAHSLPDSPSVFTEFMLRAFDGAGSDDPEDDWRVYTTSLARGIKSLFELKAQELNLPEQLFSVSGELTDFVLHYIDGKPTVPVEITCQPKEANAKAQLGYSDGSNTVMRKPSESSEWKVVIDEGDYDFLAKFQGGDYRNAEKKKYVRPPIRHIKLEVQR